MKMFSKKQRELEIFANSDFDAALVKLLMGNWERKSVSSMQQQEYLPFISYIGFHSARALYFSYICTTDKVSLSR